MGINLDYYYDQMDGIVETIRTGNCHGEVISGYEPKWPKLFFDYKAWVKMNEQWEDRPDRITEEQWNELEAYAAAKIRKEGLQ